MTDDKSSIESSSPGIDPAYELVSLLYESLRQVSACDAFRQGLARQLDVCLHSIIYHSFADSMVASYGSVGEKKTFVPQSSTDLPLVAMADGEQLSVNPLACIDRELGDGGSRWCVLWKRGDSLVQLLIDSPATTMDPESFLRSRRALLDYVLPHVGAAYAISVRQQDRTPRLNGIQAIHSMLPLPLMIVRNRDKSRLPNLQALRVLNEELKTRTERARLPGGDSGCRSARRGSESSKSVQDLPAFPLKRLGVSQATLGHQVHLLSGKEAFAAANADLLRQCFGLTAAEAELCVCAMAGKSPQAITDELALSINTVKARLKSIYRRLGVSSIAQLASLLYFHPAYWTANYNASPRQAQTRPHE